MTKLEVLLIDLSVEYPNDHESFLQGLLDRLLWNPTAAVCEARDYLLSLSSSKKNNNNECATRQNLQTQVRKFLKPQDQYLALASILLKSRIFHQCYHPYRETTRTATASSRFGDNKCRPLVNLPRTPHQKPYIPVTDEFVKEQRPQFAAQQQVDFFPLSVSHQYPFAGVVSLVGGNTTRATNHDTSIRHVGMDIVVFEDRNPRLYETTLEFVQVFQSSFSAAEWRETMESLQHNCDVQLRELYLRWSIKEAYTKALGVGLGFDFSSFEVHLQDAATSSRQVNCLWEHVMASLSNSASSSGAADKDNVLPVLGRPLHLRAQIVQCRDTLVVKKRPKHEDWLFIFFPLLARDLQHCKSNAAIGNLSGCACVAMGPLQAHDTAENVQCRYEVTTLEGLIDWHHSAGINES